MLKRILFISLFFTVVFNFTVTGQTEFVGFENIKVINAPLQSVPLGADALLNNPNDVGGFLRRLMSKKIQYKGNTTFKVLGYSSCYVVNETQDPNIKF